MRGTNQQITPDMERSDEIKTRLPFVSVIVPVHNSAVAVQTCILSLLDQTYPSDRYEVLVVDNGSTDHTRDVIRKNGIPLLTENRMQGSYAARNRGLMSARGSIIAFTDADCIPVRHWIERGVAGLLHHSAHLVCGQVRFTFSPRKTGAEMWDAINYLQIKRDIRVHGVGKTANLFVQREVFNKIGPFPREMKSGGDVLWTRRATSGGFKLVFVPEAEVAHPARKLIALIQKSLRVGSAQPTVSARLGDRLSDYPERIMRHLLPPRPLRTYRLVKGHYPDAPLARIICVLFASWICRTFTALGNLFAFPAVITRDQSSRSK